jgi:hypothetical protein
MRIASAVILVVAIARASPLAQSDDVAGHYVLTGMMEVGSELLLKPDGQFEFMLAYGAADYWARGTWKREKDAVILTSSGTKEEPFRFLRSDAGTSGRIRVSVLGKNGRGVPHIRVTLHAAGGDSEATTTDDGAAVFPDVAKPRAVSFEVRVYELQAGPFDINPAHKDIYFEINGDAIQQVLFADEPLQIEDTSLVMKHWGADRLMRYEKQ